MAGASGTLCRRCGWSSTFLARHFEPLSCHTADQTALFAAYIVTNPFICRACDYLAFDPADILRYDKIHWHLEFISHADNTRDEIIAAMLNFQAQHVRRYENLAVTDIIDISSNSDSVLDEGMLPYGDLAFKTEEEFP